MDGSDPFNNQGRPFTHEGRTHIPAPPEATKRSKRSFRTVSPKEISVGFADKWSATPPSTAPHMISGQSTRPMTGTSPLRSRRGSPERTAVIASHEYRHDTHDQSIGARPGTSHLQSSVRDDFLKPSSHPDLSPRPTTAAVKSTLFPSLSDRLRAKISIAPSASAQMNEAIKRGGAKAGSHSGARRGDISAKRAPRPKVKLPKTASSESLQESIASTNFDDMDLRSVLEYLLQANDATTDQATFVHVTSRHNVEDLNKANFYDLVVLERPGHPNSGFVWSREHVRYATDYRVLPPHMVMQLSLQGLLVASENPQEEGAELIPIPVLLHEKTQLNALRRLRLFGLFKELRVFKAWRTFTQRAHIERMKENLLKHSFFSNVELVKVQWEVTRAANEIEEETQPFAFHGKGIICVTDYLALQLRHLEEVKIFLQQRVDALSEKIAEQHRCFLSSKQLEDLIQEIKDHHPLREQMENNEEDVVNGVADAIDWIRLRSIQRLEDNFKLKLASLLKMAQYRVEGKIAVLLERFWLRFKQLVLGIHTVRGHRTKPGGSNYWELDTTLFHDDGSLSELAFARNASLAVAASVPSSEAAEGALAPSSPVKEKSVEQVLAENQPRAQQAVLTEQALCSRTFTTGAKVTKDWEDQGSHLAINIELFLHNRPIEMGDFLTLLVLDGTSIAITPAKSSLLSQMHELCGALGRLIECIPDLKKHPVVRDQREADDYRPPESPDLDLGLGDLTNQKSNNYFTTLVMHPIFNSRNAYQLAIDGLRLVHAAYNEAASIESHVLRLFEIVRKLWSLSPIPLVRQIERSMAIPKIKGFIEEPDSVEELKRTQQRDRTRLMTFRNAATYLEKLPTQLELIKNLKHRVGLVACFAPLLTQINVFRAIQEHYLYQRLPAAFVTRCTIFYEFLRKMDLLFDSQNRSTMELIDLIRKLKHYDMVKDHLDMEVEFNQSMFALISNRERRQRTPAAQANMTKEELAVAHVLTAVANPKARGHAPAVNPEKLHRLFQETLEHAGMGMSKLRSYLLTQLVDLREAVMINRQRIRTQIEGMHCKIQELQLVVNDQGEVDQGDVDIRSYRHDMEGLRKVIDENVAAQRLLLEAHDIVGAANAVLLSNQVDGFREMEQLEASYDTKCLAWMVMKDISSMLDELMASRLSTVNISDLHRRFAAMKTSFEYLGSHLNDSRLLATIEKQMLMLTPKLELIAFLSSKTLRPRHWGKIGDYALRGCGIDLKFSGKQSEFVALMDVTGREPVGLGNSNRVLSKDLLIRGVDKHLANIKLISSEAVVESFLEGTLDSVDEALRVAAVETSSAWLRDSRLRERVFVELNEIRNLTELRVLSRSCWKAVTLVEATGMDMNLSSLDGRLLKAKELGLRIDRFLECYAEAQYLWMYLLHFVKFSPRGEMDRDSVRTFSGCTDDMKKMEVIIQQKSGNLYSAFITSSDGDLNAEALRGSLLSVTDDVHSSVQSLVDSCPRLSLLAYNRLLALVRIWLMGPQWSSRFVSSCVGEMFEGVGQLQFSLVAQKAYACTGFVSANKLDKVVFSEPVPLELELDHFVHRFATSLRAAIEKSCDTLIVHRVNCLKALLSDASVDVIVKSMHALLAQRVDHLEAMISHDALTSSFLLVNFISYAEDVWTCLGHPTGSIVMARPDLVIENGAFSQAWRELLSLFIVGCEANLSRLQTHVRTHKQFARAGTAKTAAILSGLILQDIYFMRVAQSLLNCERVESATELWMGHYQLRFQYAKAQRYNHCPVDVIMGNISLSYGMEYQESGCAWLLTGELNYALSKVLSSAFSLRGVTLVHATETTHGLTNSRGEFAVSGKDIALALGRICCTLSNPSSLANVRYFFAKMVLLDSVGCVNFMTIDQVGLQNVIQTAQSFWSALDHKNDQVFQDALKFPLKTRFSRNDIHAERRKNALKAFRNDVYIRQKLNMFISFILVGFASETEFSSVVVNDLTFRSIFDTVTLPYCCGSHYLGAMLASAGFVYGYDLQSSFVTALQALSKKAETEASRGGSGESLMAAWRQLSSLSVLTDLVRDCKVCMSIMPAPRPAPVKAASPRAKSKTPRASTPIVADKDSIEKETDLALILRYKEELTTFCANLWERVLLMVKGLKVDLAAVRKELLTPFLLKADPIFLPEDTAKVQRTTDAYLIKIRDPINYALIKAAYSVGLICKHSFVQACAMFLDCLQSSRSPMVIIHGDAAVGKTAVWKTAVAAIARLGPNEPRRDSLSYPVAVRLAAQKVFQLLRKHSRMKARERLQEILGTELDEPGKDTAPARPAMTPSPSRASSQSTNCTTTVLFHGSLTASALLGGFDGQGRWMDGLLVRKIRYYNELSQADMRNKSELGSGLDDDDDPSAAAQYFIVLNGPISLSVEELLHGLYFQSRRSVATLCSQGDMTHRLLALPTNESVYLEDNVKIIVETSDLSSVSPVCVSLVPSVAVLCSAEDSVSRLVNLWVRSLAHWLGDFPPWLDFLDELSQMLLGSKFVEDLLYDDLAADKPSTAFVTARVGAFLRILEELLLQCHELALENAVFHLTEDRETMNESEPDSDSSDEDDPDRTQQSRRAKAEEARLLAEKFKFLGAMAITPRARETLLLRARLSVIYAAIWGFGGSYNSGEKRKFFDSMLRDTVQHYMNADLVVPTECLVFELLLDIDRAELLPALQYDSQRKAILNNSCLSQKHLEHNVYCELLAPGAQAGTLMFRSMSTRAVSSVFQILLRAGANVMMFGPKGAGKTKLITEALDYLKQDCPSPADLMSQITQQLLEICAGATKPQGIFRALEIVRAGLAKAAKSQQAQRGSGAADFNEMWRSINSDLEAYMTGAARPNCQARAVTSAVTSLSAHSGAQGMRRWLDREFATEVPFVLETARFSYGLAFIDDVHCLPTAEASSAPKGRASGSDCPQELLRGILEGHPIFGMQKHPMSRSSVNVGYHTGSMDAAFSTGVGSPPVLHKESLSDVRMQLSQNDDYMFQRIGFVTAATGHFTDHSRQPWLSALGSHFAILSLPVFSTSELNAALAAGTVVGMSSVVKDLTVVEVLQSEIWDLSRITLSTCLRMVGSADLLLTTSLERVVRSMTLLDVSLVSRFCTSLMYGCVHVKNPGGLLQLFAHEWKRYFLDPLPPGSQRDRILSLFSEHLDGIDDKAWAVSPDWLKDLKEELCTRLDPVWTNVEALKTTVLSNADEHKAGDLYLPVAMDAAVTEKLTRRGVWSIDTKAHTVDTPLKTLLDGGACKVVTMSDLSSAEVKAVMYPAAISLLLRMVRVFSVAKKHLVVAGYPGSTKNTTILLAAKICQMLPRLFSVKESQTVSDTCSEKAGPAFDLPLFLKSVVLQVSGFTEPKTCEQFANGADMVGTVHGVLHPGQVYYGVRPAQSAAMVVNEVQQLSQHDRKLLLQLVDYSDPSSLFDDGELQGMADALRRDFKARKDQTLQALDPIGSPTGAAGPKSPIADTKHTQGAKELTNAKASDKSPQKSAVPVAPPKVKSVLTGYMFRWVQDHLRNCVKRNLRVIFSVTLSRSVEISPSMFYSAHDSLMALRKLTGQGSKKPKARDRATAAAAQKVPRPSTNRRYSVRADRSSSETSMSRASVYNPSLNVTTAKSEGGGVDDLAEKSTGSSGGHQNLANLVAQGLFTCPILGPILARQFYLIWYDIDSNEAVKGICTSVMKNRRIGSPCPALVLSLRSSAVGVYKPAVAPTPPPAASSTTSSRRISVVERQAMEKDEKRRQKFLYSAATAAKYHLEVRASDKGEPSGEIFRKVFSIADAFGVFKTFGSNLPFGSASAAATAVADTYVPYFVEEVRALMPQVLAHPLPCDALFLKEPVYTFGIEAIAERAATSAMGIIGHEVRKLLEFKYIAEQVLVGLQDSVVFLENDDDMDQKLIKNNEELGAAVRVLSREINRTRKALETVHLSFQKSCAYECQQMLMEDISSTAHRAHLLQESVDGLVQGFKLQLEAFAPHDWQAFSALFSVKPYPKPAIEAMRAVMVLINFTPPKVLKGDKHGSGHSGHVKMDDDVAARCSVGLLLKSSEFAAQLCSVSAANMSQMQTNALRIMNSLLNSGFVAYFDVETVSAPQRLAVQEQRAGHDPAANPVLDVLRRFLLAVDLQAAMNEYLKEQRPCMDELIVDLEVIRKANAESQVVLSNDLKQALDKFMSQMSLIDSTILGNRKKLDTINRNRERKPTLLRALDQVRSHVEEEYNKVASVLHCLVGDVCVALVLLQRCGWLPEPMRQDCADVLRRHLRFQGVQVSDSPYLAGCMMDRLQMRSFTTFSEGSLANDVPHANAVAMLYLAPAHVLVIDPDGVSVQGIVDSAPKGFETYSLPAQKFSLPVFETWVDGLFDARPRDSAMYLIIYDLQAGLSDDLVCFLSGRLDCGHCQDPDSEELEEALPRLAINSALAGSTGGKLAFVSIPSKLRVVLVSTKAPRFDAFGDSSPLPIICMDHVTVVHWPSLSCPFVVETKPFEAACERLHLSSNLLAQRLAHRVIPCLVGSGANSVPAKLQQYNQQIVKQAQSLVDLESFVMIAVYECLEDDRKTHTESFSVEGLVDQQNVSLGILASDDVIELLSDSSGPRDDMQAQIMYTRMHFREQLAYFEAVGDMFTMASDYVRLCGSLLPVHDMFAPYSLAPAALAYSFLPIVMSSPVAQQIFKKAPSSIYAALRVWTGVVALQRRFRSSKQKSPPSRSPSAMFRATSMRRSGSLAERRESVRVAHATEQTKKSVEEHSRSCGLAPKARERGVAVMQYLLCPLRGRIMREVVRYAELNIRPGYEYLAKYVLLLAVWAQSADVAAEEVRTLFHLLFECQGVQDLRFVHVLPLQRMPEAGAGAMLNRLSAMYLRQSTVQWSNRMLRASALCRRPSELPGASLVPAAGTDRDQSLTEEGFLDELPGMASVKNRVTAFRVFHARKASSALAAVSVPTRGASAIRLGHPLWRSELLLERGHGALDGVFFSTRGCAWTMQATPGHPVNYCALFHSAGGQSLQTKFVMADQGLDLQPGNRLARGPVAYGDPFEVEWLKNRGVRAFHTLNAIALQALGASTKAIEDINKSRRHTVTLNKAGPGKSKVVSSPRGKRISAAGLPIKAGAGHPTLTVVTGGARRSSIMQKNKVFVDPAEETVRASVPEGPSDAPTQRLSSRRLTTRAPSLLEDMVTANLDGDAGRRESDGRVQRIVLSRRKSTAHTRRSSTTKASAFSPAPKGAQFVGGGAATSSTEDLLEVVKDRRSFQSLLLLESHPVLSQVYKGISTYIDRNAADFLDWRDSLAALAKVDCKKVARDQVLDALTNAKPPVCLEFDPDDDKGLSDDGLFMRGYELSVLQSLVLSEALWPGTAVTLLDLVFVVLRDYLRKGGFAVVYPDEVLVDEDDAFEAPSADDDDGKVESRDRNGDEQSASSASSDEDDDHFDTNAPSGRASMKATDPLRKASQSSFFKSLQAYDTALEEVTALQDNIAPSNCWTLLARALRCDRSELPGPEVAQFFTASARSLRDLYNWEAVLLQVCSDYLEIDKFVFMKELRDTLAGAKATYFLAPLGAQADPPQLAIFSQRARDYALLTSKHVPIVFCDLGSISADLASALSADSVGGAGAAGVAFAKAARTQLSDVIKAIKLSITSADAKRAIIERLDLASAAGTSILHSVLLPATSYRTIDAQSASATKDDGRFWRDSFPLIATSAWGRVLPPPASGLDDEARTPSAPAQTLAQAQAVVACARADRAFGPPVALAELSFAWLPRFFAPDVVRLPEDAAAAAAVSISMPESCGVLYEELEASLLWVINATKLVKRTRVTAEIRARLNRANKLQTRMIAVLLTISQLQGYLCAQAMERRELQGLWSACLNQLDLWQLSRVTVKLADLLAVKWVVRDVSVGLTREELLAHAPFRRAVKVLAESLSRPGMSFYSYAPPVRVESTARRRLLTAAQAVVKAQAPAQAQPPSVLAKMNGLKALVLQLKPNLAAIVDSEGASATGGALAGGAVTGKSRNLRAQKQWRKALRKLEEGRVQYVHHLSNTLMLRAMRLPPTEATAAGGGAASADALVGPAMPRVDSAQHSEAASVRVTAQHRLLTLLEHFIAEVVVLRTSHHISLTDELEEGAHGPGTARERRASASVENVVLHIVNARKHSNKMNIRSVIAEGLLGDKADEAGSTGALDTCFGSLGAEDTLQGLVKWTLDGDDKVGRLGGVDRMRILRSIKRLSVHIRQQQVQPQS